MPNWIPPLDLGFSHAGVSYNMLQGARYQNTLHVRANTSTVDTEERLHYLIRGLRSQLCLCKHLDTILRGVQGLPIDLLIYLKD